MRTLALLAAASVLAQAPQPAFRSRIDLVEVVWPDGSRSHASTRGLPAAAGPRTDPVAFPIDTAQLPPGRYELRVTATRRGSSETVERIVPFDVVAATKPR